VRINGNFLGISAAQLLRDPTFELLIFTRSSEGVDSVQPGSLMAQPATRADYNPFSARS
jgi:hypothetical protein